MECSGCQKMTRSEASRRDFLRVGSLGFLGIHLQDYLRAATAGISGGKAQSCILLWLEGGPSHVDTWDPKQNSAFKAISTNVAGIQVSELLPQLSKQMDKLAIVRSMHTKGNDHPQATHYAVTGHEVNPAMHFPSLGSIVAKELGPAERNSPVRAGAEVGEQSPVRRILPIGVLGAGLRSDVHPGSEQERLRSAGSGLAEIALRESCR